MATNWGDLYAKCPYFIRSDGKTQIQCVGVIEDTSLIWELGDMDLRNAQMKAFCCDKYKNCEVYQMLKKIYEEDQ